MFNRVIVAVVGGSNSGKTTAIEAIISGLTKKGYTVASAKRIPEKEFTIDTKGKFEQGRPQRRIERDAI